MTICQPPQTFDEPEIVGCVESSKRTEIISLVTITVLGYETEWRPRRAMASVVP